MNYGRGQSYTVALLWKRAIGLSHRVAEITLEEGHIKNAEF